MGELSWIFDPIPPSGEITGGDVTQYVFPRELDTLVREAIQNSNDQRLPGVDRAHVVFEFHDLIGDEKRTALDSLGWSELEPHLEAVASSSSLIAGRVRDTLELNASDEPLRVLVIKDFGTKGLFGGEDSRDGNFAPLCRHRLVTTDDKTMGGGSHGLGKAVLWAFSRIATAAFSSIPFIPGSEPIAKEPLRFIARADLPYHEMLSGERCKGSGWLGVPNVAQDRAESARAETAEAAVHEPLLGRDDLGTSILIPWFFEPKEEEPRPLAEIAEDTARSIRKWFWPSLVEGRLRAEVRVYERGATLFDREVVADDSVQAFVAAWSDPITGERAIEPDELAERMVDVTPPKLKAESNQGGRPGVVVLRVRRTGEAAPEPAENGERVALVRGAFMVVEYWKPKGAQFGGDGWVGVMRAGLARGDENSDNDIEAFLRAAEPPAHDKWEKGTNRLQSEYRRGAGATLEALFGKASLLVTEMSRPEPADSVLGPQKLAKMFKLPGTGPPKSERYSVVVEDQALEYPLWTATAVVKGPKDSGSSGWKISGTLRADSESGTGESVDIRSVESDGLEENVEITGNSFRAEVRNRDEVRIKLTGDASALNREVAERSRLRIELRAARRGST